MSNVGVDAGQCSVPLPETKIAVKKKAKLNIIFLKSCPILLYLFTLCQIFCPGLWLQRESSDGHSHLFRGFLVIAIGYRSVYRLFILLDQGDLTISEIYGALIYDNISVSYQPVLCIIYNLYNI